MNELCIIVQDRITLSVKPSSFIARWWSVGIHISNVLGYIGIWPLLYLFAVCEYLNGFRVLRHLLAASLSRFVDSRAELSKFMTDHLLSHRELVINLAIMNLKLQSDE
jgi:hypothetical protein